MTLARLEASPLVGWSDEAQAAANIAHALAGTPFVPDSLRVFTDPDHKHVDLQATTATVAAALLTGQELGMTPMASLRSIDVIRGTPALRAVALRALLQRGGHRVWLVESTKTRCVMRGQRAGDEHVQEVVWTLDRAKDLRINGFGDPRGSWQRQPQNMLIARATAEIARLIAADALLGLPYVVEEVDDLDGAGPESGPTTPIDPAQPPKRTARRRSSTAPPSAHAPTAGTVTAGGAPTLTPTMASPLGDEPSLNEPSPAERVGGRPHDVAPGTVLISTQQSRTLHAGLRDIELTDRDEALAQISEWVGRDIASTNELTRDEATAVIRHINIERTRRAQQREEDGDEPAADDDPR